MVNTHKIYINNNQMSTQRKMNRKKPIQFSLKSVQFYLFTQFGLN